MILYKYFAFSGGTRAIKSRQLGFRTPTYFNDPFELTGLSNISDYPTIQTQIEWLQDFGVLCLTKSPMNPLMWAHYGDQHKGFVVGYDVSVPFLNDPKFNIISAMDGNVFYTSQKENTVLSPDMRAQLLRELQDSAMGGDGSGSSTQLIKRILLQKHLCWAYEEEVRVVKRVTCGLGQSVDEFYESPENIFKTITEPISGTDDYHVQAKPGCEGLYLSEVKVPIKEVYLGLRCADALDEETIKSLEEVPSLFQVTMAGDSWNLQANQIEVSSLREAKSGL